MFWIPNPEMFPNKFVEVSLPTKGQIFDRTGKRAVSPAGAFAGDEPLHFASSPTASAEKFLEAAESYEKPENGDSEK